jgi:hypothetical protein
MVVFEIAGAIFLFLFVAAAMTGVAGSGDR